MSLQPKTYIISIANRRMKSFGPSPQRPKRGHCPRNPTNTMICFDVTRKQTILSPEEKRFNRTQDICGMARCMTLGSGLMQVDARASEKPNAVPRRLERFFFGRE